VGVTAALILTQEPGVPAPGMRRRQDAPRVHVIQNTRITRRNPVIAPALVAVRPIDNLRKGPVSGTTDPAPFRCDLWVIPLDEGSFAVEVSIPETYPAKVSPFATEAEAEAWIGEHRRRVQSESEPNRRFRGSGSSGANRRGRR
jgi:hypothetical protein